MHFPYLFYPVTLLAAVLTLQSAPPNIVVIIADDLGYSDISHNPYSPPEVSTPNIDSLIQEGVWFSNAYANANICAPSRTAFFAGKYQANLGVHIEFDVNNRLDPATTILPEFLKQAGDGVEDHVSKMVGKWHMGRDRSATVSIDGNTDNDFTDFEDDYGTAVLASMPYNPMSRGFDDVYGFINLGGQSYWDYGSGFFDSLHRYQVDEPIDGLVDGDAVATYLTTRLTDVACDTIEDQVAAGKPFYVHVAYNAPHTPLHAPTSPVGLSEGDADWYPDAAYYNSEFPNMWESATYSSPSNSVTNQANRSILMAMLYHMDQGIGRIVAQLKDPNGDGNEADSVYEDTIIVFWSDNGGAAATASSNIPLHGTKQLNYEGGVRVPMSITWPNGLSGYAGDTVDAPIMAFDLLPTILDACGIEPAGGGFDQFDGKSVLPLIRGEVSELHEALYWSEGQNGEYAIRKGRWKLYIDEDSYELYDLDADIGEGTDLADLYPEVLRELRQMHYAWMVETTTAAGIDLDERLWNYTTPAPEKLTATLSEEAFDYTAGSLNGQSGGAGWASGWSGDMLVADGSLVYSNPYYTNSASLGRSSNDETTNFSRTSTRVFEEPITDAVVWLSFLSSFDPDQASGGPSANAWQALFFNGQVGDSLTLFGGNGNAWSGAFDDAPDKDRDTVGSLVSTQSIFTDEHATYLSLVKMETDVSGTNDRITWYVTKEPTALVGSDLASLEAAVSAGTVSKVVATSSDGDWWGSSLQSIGIEVINQDNSDLADMSFDNIRLSCALSDDDMLAVILTGNLNAATGATGTNTGVDLVGYDLVGDRFELEVDEYIDWLPDGPVVEATGSLLEPWQTATPDVVVQTDRYLDRATYKLGFNLDTSTRFFRVQR